MPAWLVLAVLLASGGPDDALAEARALRQQGRAEEAVAVLDAALADGADRDGLLGLLGLCLADVGARARVESLAGELADYDGDDYRVFVFLGRRHELLGEGPAALDAYRAALARHDALEARFGLVNVYLGTGRLGKAKAEAEAVEALQPERGRRLVAMVLAAQADRYMAAGGEAIALAADKYIEALEKSPDDPALAERALEVLIIAVRDDVAAEVIAARFGDPEREPAAAYWTGRRLDALQDPDGARRYFEFALEREPEHLGSLLALAKLALDRGDADAARELLQRCGPATSAGVRQCLLLGEVHEELGQLADAERHLRRALELEPENPKALYGLGRLLLRTGRRDEGAQLLATFQEVRSRTYEEEEDR